jgi:hypothetical protein
MAEGEEVRRLQERMRKMQADDIRKFNYAMDLAREADELELENIKLKKLLGEKKESNFDIFSREMKVYLRGLSMERVGSADNDLFELLEADKEPSSRSAMVEIAALAFLLWWKKR